MLGRKCPTLWFGRNGFHPIETSVDIRKSANQHLPCSGIRPRNQLRAFGDLIICELRR